MTKELLKTSFLWGFTLWLIGYVLGIVLFPFAPTSLIGWIITPVGIAIALLVLFKKIKLNSLREYVILGVIWMLLAIILDYFLLVKVFKPADGYYKLDVYLYYGLTLLLPIFVGFTKINKK